MIGLAGLIVLTPDVCFAATLPREEAMGLICMGITQTPFQGTHRVTVIGWIRGQSEDRVRSSHHRVEGSVGSGLGLEGSCLQE